MGTLCVSPCMCWVLLHDLSRSTPRQPSCPDQVPKHQRSNRGFYWSYHHITNHPIEHRLRTFLRISAAGHLVTLTHPSNRSTSCWACGTLISHPCPRDILFRVAIKLVPVSLNPTMSFLFGRTKSRTTADLPKQARDHISKLDGLNGASKVRPIRYAPPYLRN